MNQKTARKNERGFSMVMTAFFGIVIVFVGLGVAELGQVYIVKSSRDQTARLAAMAAMRVYADKMGQATWQEVLNEANKVIEANGYHTIDVSGLTIGRYAFEDNESKVLDPLVPLARNNTPGSYTSDLSQVVINWKHGTVNAVKVELKEHPHTSSFGKLLTEVLNLDAASAVATKCIVPGEHNDKNSTIRIGGADECNTCGNGLPDETGNKNCDYRVPGVKLYCDCFPEAHECAGGGIDPQTHERTGPRPGCDPNKEENCEPQVLQEHYTGTIRCDYCLSKGDSACTIKTPPYCGDGVINGGIYANGHAFNEECDPPGKTRVIQEQKTITKTEWDPVAQAYQEVPEEVTEDITEYCNSNCSGWDRDPPPDEPEEEYACTGACPAGTSPCIDASFLPQAEIAWHVVEQCSSVQACECLAEEEEEEACPKSFVCSTETCSQEVMIGDKIWKACNSGAEKPGEKGCYYSVSDRESACSKLGDGWRVPKPEDFPENVGDLPAKANRLPLVFNGVIDMEGEFTFEETEGGFYWLANGSLLHCQNAQDGETLTPRRIDNYTKDQYPECSWAAGNKSTSETYSSVIEDAGCVVWDNTVISRFLHQQGGYQNSRLGAGVRCVKDAKKEPEKTLTLMCSVNETEVTAGEFMTYSLNVTAQNVTSNISLKLLDGTTEPVSGPGSYGPYSYQIDPESSAGAKTYPVSAAADGLTAAADCPVTVKEITWITKQVEAGWMDRINPGAGGWNYYSDQATADRLCQAGGYAKAERLDPKPYYNMWNFYYLSNCWAVSVKNQTQTYKSYFDQKPGSNPDPNYLGWYSGCTDNAALGNLKEAKIEGSAACPNPVVAPSTNYPPVWQWVNGSWEISDDLCSADPQKLKDTQIAGGTCIDGDTVEIRCPQSDTIKSEQDIKRIDSGSLSVEEYSLAEGHESANYLCTNIFTAGDGEYYEGAAKYTWKDIQSGAKFHKIEGGTPVLYTAVPGQKVIDTVECYYRYPRKNNTLGCTWGAPVPMVKPSVKPDLPTQIPDACPVTPEPKLSCEPDASSVKTGESVTWTASITNGDASKYEFAWAGPVARGNATSFSESYNTEGVVTYTVQATPKSGTGVQTVASYSCTVNVENLKKERPKACVDPADQNADSWEWTNRSLTPYTQTCTETGSVDCKQDSQWSPVYETVYAPTNTTTPCQYQCVSGKEWRDGKCQDPEPVVHQCIGELPQDAILCVDGSFLPASDTPYEEVSECPEVAVDATLAQQCQWKKPAVNNGQCIDLDHPGFWLDKMPNGYDYAGENIQFSGVVDVVKNENDIAAVVLNEAFQASNGRVMTVMKPVDFSDTYTESDNTWVVDPLTTDEKGVRMIPEGVNIYRIYTPRKGRQKIDFYLKNSENESVLSYSSSDDHYAEVAYLQTCNKNCKYMTFEWGYGSIGQHELPRFDSNSFSDIGVLSEQVYEILSQNSDTKECVVRISGGGDEWMNQCVYHQTTEFLKEKFQKALRGSFPDSYTKIAGILLYHPVATEVWKDVTEYAENGTTLWEKLPRFHFEPAFNRETADRLCYLMGPGNGKAIGAERGSQAPICVYPFSWFPDKSRWDWSTAGSYMCSETIVKVVCQYCDENA